MRTVSDCVSGVKCRKGPSAGTTKSGAFWLACEPIKIRSYGGDGVGNNAADCTNYLQLRHYRDGEVRAVIHGDYWHQNGAGPDDYVSVPEILECTTVEEVIVRLKGTKMPGGNSTFSTYYEGSLTDALTHLGVEEREPSPDEI